MYKYVRWYIRDIVKQGARNVVD